MNNHLKIEKKWNRKHMKKMLFNNMIKWRKHKKNKYKLKTYHSIDKIIKNMENVFKIEFNQCTCFLYHGDKKRLTEREKYIYKKYDFFTKYNLH